MLRLTDQHPTQRPAMPSAVTVACDLDCRRPGHSVPTSPPIRTLWLWGAIRPWTDRVCVSPSATPCVPFSSCVVEPQRGYQIPVSVTLFAGFNVGY